MGVTKGWIWAGVITAVVFGTASLVFAEETTPPATSTPPAASAPSAPEAATPPAAPTTPPAVPAVPGVKTKPALKAEARAEKKESSGYGKTEGLLGPVTLGPVIGVALPHPLNVGIEGRYQDWVGFQADYGFLPEISFQSVKASMSAIDVRGRLFPFRGAFFLGLGLGRQTVKASDSRAISSLSNTLVSAAMDVKSTYLTPHLGWRWQWKSGFVLGMDFGWQFSLANSTTITTNAPSAATSTAEYVDLMAKINDVGNDVGKAGLPHLTVLQLGYMF